MVFFAVCPFDHGNAQSRTCNCSCYNLDVGLNADPELQEKVKNLTKELEVDSKTTNSHIRSLTSATDPRPSAQAAGYVGIVMLTIVFGSLVLMDMTRLCKKPDEDFDDGYD